MEKNMMNQEKQTSGVKTPRLNDPEQNPCLKEYEMSLDCLGRSKKDECTLYFENYKQCRKFWSNIIKARKDKGIKPHVPPVSEREALKANYTKKNLFTDAELNTDR